jgi:hypothetical protein
MTIASLAPPAAVTALNSSGGMCGKIAPTITTNDHLHHIFSTTELPKLEQRSVHQVAGRYQMKAQHSVCRATKANKMSFNLPQRGA